MITFAIAFAIEFLNFKIYEVDSNINENINKKLGTKFEPECWTHSKEGRNRIFVYNFLSLYLSYLLMLIVMTFNFGLFMAAVLGLTAGYFVFGFTRKRGYS